MIFLRPIKETDLEAFIALNKLSSIGMTSLPKDARLLEKKLYLSLDSFKKNVTNPENEFYLFALEDSQEHTIIGNSAIFATTGGGESLYFFQKETLHSPSTLDDVTKSLSLLTPISYIRGPSEICSLFLHPEKRKHGLGKLLSLARFHFIAAFPERFTNSVFTELRGVIENDKCLFWDGVGRHFFNVSFSKVIDLLKYGKSFITHFLPKYPIYTTFLPKEVQDVIGKTHSKTRAALVMLLQEGFEMTDEIDIFDGGPKLRALKNNIRTIYESKVFQIAAIQDDIEQNNFLLSNEKINFRACIGSMVIKDETSAIITSETSESLQVGLGDSIRSSPIHEGEGK